MNTKKRTPVQKKKCSNRFKELNKAAIKLKTKQFCYEKTGE